MNKHHKISWKSPPSESLIRIAVPKDPSSVTPLAMDRDSDGIVQTLIKPGIRLLKIIEHSQYIVMPTGRKRKARMAGSPVSSQSVTGSGWDSAMIFRFILEI